MAPQGKSGGKKQLTYSTGNAIEAWYARINCRWMGGKYRLRVYRKLASLLRNRFSLMDALERQYAIVTDDGRKPDEPWAIALATWIRRVQNGESFSDALRGWAPNQERMMLSVGDVSNLETALDNLIKVTEGIDRMISPIIGAVAYPAFLMILVVLIIYAVGAYMVPPMIEVAPDLIWTGLAKNLVDVSKFVQVYWLVCFSVLPVTFLVIFLSFSRWKGRTRSWIDDIPPYSMYKIFSGLSWILSLSALVKSGTSVSKAMKSLAEQSNPYLAYRLNKALAYINNGDNIGEALYKTGLKFPDKEIIGDLRIYAELDNFQEALSQVGQEWLNTAEESVMAKAEVLNMVAILFVSGVIAWAVMGTFEMQNQMVKGMGIG
ncbi:type II secretion system protein F [Alphaproteobacteria bacterium]|nr:type II secretion system protein F [Alphaproteobacteria bacterium]